MLLEKREGGGGGQKEEPKWFCLVILKNREIRNKTVNKWSHEQNSKSFVYFTNLFLVLHTWVDIGMNHLNFDMRLVVDASFYCFKE